MRYTKEQRQEIRDARDRGFIPSTGMLIGFLDDLDTLEAQLKWAEEMLERADTIIKAAVLDCVVEPVGRPWLADLAAGPGEK